MCKYLRGNWKYDNGTPNSCQVEDRCVMLQCMRVNCSHRYVQESMHTSVDPNKCSREDSLITHQSLDVDPSQQLLYCIMNKFWFHDLYIFETVFGTIYIYIYVYVYVYTVHTSSTYVYVL